MTDQRNFALLGAAGYIAPRHLKAIQACGGRLVAASDPHDSVGLLDQHFPDAAFFTEYERFDRYLEKLRRRARIENGIDYLSVCSPNYFHDAHVRLALRLGADAICEKPLVTSPWNLDQLAELEAESGKRVYTILQLRLLPQLILLRQALEAAPNRRRAEVELSYVSRRGRWYDRSWKGSQERSGGLAMNIGVHLFDLMLWLFGPCEATTLSVNEPRRMTGTLELQWGTVKWLLSIEASDLPEDVRARGGHAHRSLCVNGQALEFSDGFTDLHTRSYAEILACRGFGIEDARPAIELIHRLKTAPLAVVSAVRPPPVARAIRPKNCSKCGLWPTSEASAETALCAFCMSGTCARCCKAAALGAAFACSPCEAKAHRGA